MKNILRLTSLGVVALLPLAGGLRAQTAPAAPAAATPAAPAAAPAPSAPSTTVTFTPSLVSQYMFRGVRLGGFSFEPSIEVDSGNLALGVWSNFPLKDKVVGQSDPEIDPYGSYTITVNDSLSVAPGFTWYNYPNADTSNGFYKSTFEPNIAVNYTVGSVKFTPKIYYDMILKGPTYELTAAYTVPLKDLGSELDFTGVGGSYIITDAAKGAVPAVKNWGDYFLVGVSMPFNVGKNGKLSIGAAYTKGSNNFFKQGPWGKSENTAAVGRGVFTLSYAVTF